MECTKCKEGFNDEDGLHILCKNKYINSLVPKTLALSFMVNIIDNKIYALPTSYVWNKQDVCPYTVNK